MTHVRMSLGDSIYGDNALVHVIFAILFLHRLHAACIRLASAADMISTSRSPTALVGLLWNIIVTLGIEGSG